MPSVSAVPIPDFPFNPYDLRPLATLNRRRLVAVPGGDPAWVGKTGWELCSTPALIQLMQTRAADLGLEETATASHDSGIQLAGLPPRLNDLLASPDPAVRSAAQAIAETHGQRLGGLVASILLSPNGLTFPLTPWPKSPGLARDADAAPLDPWEAAYLRHWRQEVRQLYLGGGLSNGRLGIIIASAAEAVLKKCGIQQLNVRPASFPSYLPLIGAARRLPPGEAQVAAVADFGSTWAKRALAYYGASGELEKLLILPPVMIAPLVEPGNAALLASEMVAVLADTIRQAGPSARLAPDVVCSLAAYIVDGQPAPQIGTASGGYYALHAVSADLCGWFSEQVRLAASASRASGTSCCEVRVRFAHDGGSAGAALAGQEKAAVIMLGSALGVGFVPAGEKLRPVSPDFSL